MGKKTDDKKTRKALARIRRTLRKKDMLEGDAALSAWEDGFVGSLEERLEKYGSAFADPEKGEMSEALSWRQTAKLREVEKKLGGKGCKPLKRSRFKPKKSFGQKPARFVADARDDTSLDNSVQSPKLCAERPTGPPRLRVVSGGKSENPTK